MRALPGARVQQTPERRNYVYATVLAAPDGRDYRLFFTLRRAPGQAELKLFIESAYPVAAGGRPIAGQRVRFAILALKIWRGEPLRFAPR